MRLLLRNVIVASIILAVMMAWWYPEPVLMRIELMQWDQDHARLTAPAPPNKGAFTQARILRRAMTLEEFIASKTAGRTATATAPTWEQIMVQLERLQISGQPPLLWLRPDAGPFAELPGHLGYAQIQPAATARHLENRRLPTLEAAAKRSKPIILFRKTQYNLLNAINCYQEELCDFGKH